jgi:hypothetical protein
MGVTNGDPAPTQRMDAEKAHTSRVCARVNICYITGYHSTHKSV